MVDSLLCGGQIQRAVGLPVHPADGGCAAAGGAHPADGGCGAGAAAGGCRGRGGCAGGWSGCCRRWWRALSVGLALLDLWVGGEAFEAADFAFDVFERALLFAAVAAVAWLTVELRDLRGEQAALREDLARAVALGEAWRAGNARGARRPGRGDSGQFDAWSLTPAEADIAGLLLKGVSLRDIAVLRRTSEATIRQQAQSVYRKSGLGGPAGARGLLPRVAVRGPVASEAACSVVVDRRLRRRLVGVQRAWRTMRRCTRGGSGPRCSSRMRSKKSASAWVRRMLWRT